MNWQFITRFLIACFVGALAMEIVAFAAFFLFPSFFELTP